MMCHQLVICDVYEKSRRYGSSTNDSPSARQAILFIIL